MPRFIPKNPKIYHILHIDRLKSVIDNEILYSDSIVNQRNSEGTIIGMSKIKKRRLEELIVTCYPDLHVGDCVPFYFCPRSVMLYILHNSNHPDLDYCGGQEPIIHLEADLYKVIDWANANKKRWSFTLSNAGAFYVEFHNSLDDLYQINWSAVNANIWMNCRDAKQAEFLIEDTFPMNLIERIGVYSRQNYIQVNNSIKDMALLPKVEILREWYY